MQLSNQDRDLMARTVIGEAADQTDEGQQAVANVVMNRLKSGKYGKSASDVVLQRHQFEPWATRPRELLAYSPDSKVYQRAARAVDAAAADDAQDPTGGATHFFAPRLQAQLGRKVPSWAKGNSVAIGDHQFYAPDDPNYGKGGGAMAYSDEGGAVPDLLSRFVKTPAAAPASTSQPVNQDDDLLGSWAKTSAPAAKPAASAPAAAPAPTDGEETLPEAVNRWAAEHQGDSYTDAAARLGVGVLRGGGDVADTIAQGIAGGVNTGAGFLAKHGLISPEHAQAVQDWQAGVNQGIARDQQGFDAAAGDSAMASAGRVGGNIIVSAPLLETGAGALGALTRGAPIAATLAARPMLSAAVRGAGAGAGANLLTSSTSDQPLSDQLMTGAGTGAVLGPLGYGAARLGSRLVSGGVDQETAQLARAARDLHGIPVTAGQVTGNPAVRFLDSVMQRIPFTGYGARTAAQQTGLNRAVAQTFGEDADKITYQTISNAKNRIGRVFDDVAARTGPMPIDHQFSTELLDIADAAHSLEVRPVTNQIGRIVRQIDPATGTLDAETYQALTRKGAPLERAQSDKDPNVRFYANKVRSALDDLMQRNAPADVVDNLRNARSQWKAMKTVEPLAKKATTGDISAPLLLSAVNKSYSGAGGTLGELGRIGQRFVKEPPSSGTAERLMIMQHLPQLAVGATGLGAIGAAEHFEPDSWQRNAALAGGALLAGRAGSATLRSNWLTNAMIRSGLRQQVAPSAARDLVRVAFPAAGAIANRGPLRLTVNPNPPPDSR